MIMIIIKNIYSCLTFKHLSHSLNVRKFGEFSSLHVILAWARKGTAVQKEVRFATVEDFNFIYDALREDLAEQGLLHRFKYSQVEFKNAIFGENPLATFLILLMNDQPAGFANYSIDHRSFTVHDSPNLYMNDIFVKKPYRRMGGATLLVDTLKEIAKQENCGRIDFFVLAENASALKFYEKSFKSKIISDGLHYMRLELND